jgi:hypothetical protein
MKYDWRTAKETLLSYFNICPLPKSINFYYISTFAQKGLMQQDAKIQYYNSRDITLQSYQECAGILSSQ